MSEVAPFVLLDDARSGGCAWLYEEPTEVIETHEPDEVKGCLDRLRSCRRHAAGFISYEAGYALEPKLMSLAKRPPDHAPPLLWFGLFDQSEPIDAATWLPDPAGAWCGAPRPLVSETEYRAAVLRVLEHILAGDIYQANFTFQTEAPAAGDPRALYAALRARASAGHGALLFTGAHWILSLSPELFFTLDGRTVTSRPMKGTAPRDADPAELTDDPKQRAENLMIVDLIRNDLSRVSKAGTVKVPRLFEVETYPTLLQMTSTVTGELAADAGAVDVVETIFPCGSITGAPKIRAMEILNGLEKGPRGIYCGAIGSLAPSGAAAFNVAIRTLVLETKDDQNMVARIGLGSGIVADSRADEEWRECLAKGAFLETKRRFDLIETMAFDPLDGISDLDRHLDRLKRSADALDFRFDRHVARNELQAATFRAGPSLVRLLLSRSGAMAIELRALPAEREEPVEVAIAPLPVDPADFRLRHKTTDREFYDEALAASGAFETVFRDPAGFLTEGSFTTLFVERGGKLLTPPLARGLLPGVLRERLIEDGRAEEADLAEAELLDGFLIGNSVRGLLRATLRI